MLSSLHECRPPAPPADAGGLVESASERARLALWFGLQVGGRVQGRRWAALSEPRRRHHWNAGPALRGRSCRRAGRLAGVFTLAACCHRPRPPCVPPLAEQRACVEAVRLAAEASGGPGSISGPSKSHKAGGKAAEIKLDFFGAEVRAQVRRRRGASRLQSSGGAARAAAGRRLLGACARLPAKCAPCAPLATRCLLVLLAPAPQEATDVGVHPALEPLRPRIRIRSRAPPAPQEVTDTLRQWRLVEARLAALGPLDPPQQAQAFALTNAETPALTQARRAGGPGCDLLLRRRPMLARWVQARAALLFSSFWSGGPAIAAPPRGPAASAGQQATWTAAPAPLRPPARPPARPQWMRTAEWGEREDAMLLLGCWRHGINAWDK